MRKGNGKMSYKRNQIIALLYRIFQAEEWTWRSLHSPTYKELEESVEDLEKSAYEVKGFAESGRIKVYYDKQSQFYDYYLSLGSD